MRHSFFIGFKSLSFPCFSRTASLIFDVLSGGCTTMSYCQFLRCVHYYSIFVPMSCWYVLSTEMTQARRKNISQGKTKCELSCSRLPDESHLFYWYSYPHGYSCFSTGRVKQKYCWDTVYVYSRQTLALTSSSTSSISILVLLLTLMCSMYYHALLWRDLPRLLILRHMNQFDFR